ncbi:MAG TPA: HNH endonuclease [Pyrinomonadaceae bacterium]|jgi:5-methylcytosine-specific restriction endonuclease McrA|nr:HNH endonuclease [Pyrinomonadaceae bacterium]
MALDGRVLLLNQTYEPLGTVSVARAVIMVFKNTVSVEEFDGDRVLRSARAEFPVPSVIRRRIYINIRRRREASSMKRLRIFMRDKFRCQYCGDKKRAGELTLDHILPRSRGGDNSPVNVVTACVACNNRKGDRTPAEARMPLLTSQSALRVKLERVVLCHYAEARVEWRKYLFMDVYDDRDVRERVEREQARNRG